MRSRGSGTQDGFAAGDRPPRGVLSEAWKADCAADEAGLLPAGMKRGVLSENGVYGLLERFGEIEG